MNDRGPFLWLSKKAPPAGFSELPRGGMCLSTFLFVTRKDRILLGKYADDPKWEELAGLDADRRRTNANGWTIPASHLKFGEDPRDAARRIGEHIVRMSGARYSEPRTEVDLYPSKMVPGEMHYDIWFLVDAAPPNTYEPQPPAWYTELRWHDPRTAPASEYARGHEDVVARWLTSHSEGTRRAAESTR
ncbi:MAG TPA: hypothetical protein VEO18_04410 [Thermoplasmata archaeon]|nr:hypothetical protein [Thermoplasmata archaeon]